MKKLLTFTATWCGPCKMLKPILQQLHDEGLIVWENHDIDENKELAQTMNIKSVPSLLFYENNEVTFTASGFMPREKVLKLYYPNGDFKETAPTIVEDVVLEAEPVLEAVLEAEAVVEAELVADEATEVVLEEVVEDEPVVEVELEEESIVNDEELVQDEPIVEDDIVIENEEPIKHETPVTIKKEPVSIIDLIDDTVIFDGAVFDDEFSSEDLGNDTPEDVVDPEDLF
jgi:thioredoxin 1